MFYTAIWPALQIHTLKLDKLVLQMTVIVNSWSHWTYCEDQKLWMEICCFFFFFVRSDWSLPTFGPFHHTICNLSLGTIIVNHVDVTERVGGSCGLRNGHFVLTNRADHSRREREENGVSKGRQTGSSEHWEQNWPTNMAEGMLGVISGSGWSAFWRGWVSSHCFLRFFWKGGGGVLQQKFYPVTPTPHPSLFRGNRLPAPFCLPPSPAFPLAAQFLLFTAFCMKVAICEDYPAWGLKKKIL